MTSLEIGTWGLHVCEDATTTWEKIVTHTPKEISRMHGLSRCKMSFTTSKKPTQTMGLEITTIGSIAFERGQKNN
jgi:hypothetical protein